MINQLDRRGLAVCLLVVVAVAVNVAVAGETRHPVAQPGPLTFTVENVVGDTAPKLVTVSMPFVPGETSGEGAWRCRLQGGSIQPIAMQSRTLSEYRQGSARTILLRFPWGKPLAGSQAFLLEHAQGGTGQKSLLVAHDDAHFTIQAGTRRLRLSGENLEIWRGGVLEAQMTILAPGFPIRFHGPEVSVLEEGPCSSWVKATYYSAAWNAMLEVKADVLGETEFIVRLLRTSGAARVPHFGLAFELPATQVRLGDRVLTDLAASLEIRKDKIHHLQLVSKETSTTLFFPEGPQTREGRISVAREAGKATLRVYRDVGLDENPNVEYFEGQQRSVRVTMLNPELGTAAGEVEPHSLVGLPSARRRAAAVMGEGPTDWGPLNPIRAKLTEFALGLQSRDGDAYGDVGMYSPVKSPRYEPNELLRLDQGVKILEDYYYGGDSRLRQFALNWAEEYVDLHSYQGNDLNAYGAEVYAASRTSSVINYTQKGIYLLVHAYEETGDLRYLKAVLANADRVVAMLNGAYFNRDYFFHSGWVPQANVRTSYYCKDLVKLYRYTGQEKYLQTAKKLLRDLDTLRDKQHFWKETYYDPYSPTGRQITGDGVGITQDTVDYPKPFILQYMLYGAQAVSEETRDPFAKDIVVRLSDWYVEGQHFAAGYGYPQMFSPLRGTWLSLLVGDALLKSFELTHDQRYWNAAVRSLRLATNLFQRYGMVPALQAPSDLVPSYTDFYTDTWGLLLKVPRRYDKEYFYSADFGELDFKRQDLQLSEYGRDEVADFFSSTNRFLVLNRGGVQTLLEEPTDKLERYLLDDAVVQEQEESGSYPEFAARRNPLNAAFKAALAAEESDKTEEAIRLWEDFISRYLDSPLELLRIANLWAKLKTWPKVEGVYQRFLDRFPTHPRCGGVRLRLATLMEQAGDAPQAQLLYQQVLEKQPDTVWARDAAALLWCAKPQAPLPDGLLVARRRLPNGGEAEAEATTGGVAEHFNDLATGQASGVRTQVSASYDDTNIYFKILCFDAEFAAAGATRDAAGDFVEIYLDPAHAYENWLALAVNGRGERSFRDVGWARLQYSDDASEVRPPIQRNDPGWKAEVTRGGDHWTALITLPFARLGKPVGHVPKLMGLNITREIHPPAALAKLDADGNQVVRGLWLTNIGPAFVHSDILSRANLSAWRPMLLYPAMPNSFGRLLFK